MSIGVMNDVWKSSLEDSNERFVLLALADRADDHGFCWPGIGNLVSKTRLSNSTVKRCLRRLEGHGLLDRAPRFTEAGNQRSNLYRINVALLQAMRAPVSEEPPVELADLFGSRGVTQTPRPHRPPRGSDGPGEGVTQPPLGGSHRPPDTSGESARESAS